MSAETKQYLVEEFAISEAPSVKIFLACTEIARIQSESRRESLLGIGDPDFNKSRFPGLDPLASAQDEVREIARYYPGANVMTGVDATESSVRAAMTKANVIHIAAHGMVDERSALNSALALAADEGGERLGTKPETDGLLHVYEIYGIPLSHARLIVLSACRSGVEAFHRGEGMVGMARPFLAAGAPLVVSSLWKVDSKATKELMVRFHHYRKQGRLSTAQALRQAQRELLQGGGIGYSHPFYWAAFSPVGGCARF